MEKQTVTSEPNTVTKIWTAVFGLKNNETHSFVVSEEDKGHLKSWSRASSFDRVTSSSVSTAAIVPLPSTFRRFSPSGWCGI